jgi:hypothetical protein
MFYETFQVSGIFGCSLLVLPGNPTSIPAKSELLEKMKKKKFFTSKFIIVEFLVIIKSTLTIYKLSHTPDDDNDDFNNNSRLA